MGLISLLDKFKNEFDKVSGSGNIIAYPIIVRDNNKDYIGCFSIRATDNMNSTRPLMFGLADIHTEEIISIRPCVDEDMFLLDYNKKYSMVNLHTIDEHKPLFLFAMLIAIYKEEGVLDMNLYEKYLLSVIKSTGAGLASIYKEELNERY